MYKLYFGTSDILLYIVRKNELFVIKENYNSMDLEFWYPS